MTIERYYTEKDGIKVGDRVRQPGYCGIEGLVVFWTYEGIVTRIFDVPDIVRSPEEAKMWGGQEFTPARTRAYVLRETNDPTDWFVADIEDLEIVNEIR
jgi:hypothetical protein